MIIYFLITAISFFGTLYVLPHSIRKLGINNYLAKDMYKLDRPLIPTNCGIILVFTSFLTISIIPLLSRFLNYFTDIPLELYNLSDHNLAFVLVVSIYALYGLVDDLVDIGRVMKFFLPVAFAFPLVSVIEVNSIWLPFFGVKSLETEILMGIYFSDIFRIMVIPFYVMVVANLVNMHSGYNGLQSGLSIIIILTICIKSFFDNGLTNIAPVFAILGSLFAFFKYNKFPSKAFEGNIGSQFFGSTIGVLIAIQNYWWFGFFILIPHTFNFILWLVWLYLMKIAPSHHLDKHGNHTKFGSISESGAINVPSRLTLKWIPNYYFNLNEKQSTELMYCITAIFCILGLIIF